jgi:hypothetical protein
MEIKLHLNENIDWHCMHLELNSKSYLLKWIELQFNFIQFHNWIKIQLKINEMQVGGKDIGIFFTNIFLEKITLKWHKPMCFYFGMG